MSTSFFELFQMKSTELHEFTGQNHPTINFLTVLCNVCQGLTLTKFRGILKLSNPVGKYQSQENQSSFKPVTLFKATWF